MNNVSVRVMTPEEILEKITEEKNLKLSVKLAKSLNENGVVVSVFEDNFREVQVCNVCVDFSEHDKKVTEEKDKKIAELEKEIIEKNNSIIEKNQRMMELIEELQAVKAENSEYHGNAFGTAERLEELEDRHQSDCIEINRLNVALEVMTEKYMKLREVHGL